MASERSPSDWKMVAAISLLVAGLWLLFVGSFHRNELLIGIPASVLSIAFVRYAWLLDSPTLDVTWKDVLACWRIPWYVLKGLPTIVLVLLKDLAGKRAESFYRYSGFKTSKNDPHSAGRRVLATAYTTATPNFIVVGIDVNQSRMLFHQILRTEVPQMTKELGAIVGVQQQ